MAAILTIAAGVLGFLVGIVSLLLGASFLTAFALWAGVALAAAILGLAWPHLHHTAPLRA